MVPGLGNNSKSKLQVSLGWRYADAHRSYFDSRINHDFTRLWDPHLRLSVLDVTARYQYNKRFSTTFSIPVVFNRFAMLYPPRGKGLGLSHASYPRGLGDISIYNEAWLLDGKKHPFHNIALGVGIKIPSGNWNYKAILPDETGFNFARRPVYPPASMPGDGGVGILVGFQAFRTLRNELPIIHGSTIFASANYLINPRDTNGTASIAKSLGVPLNAAFNGALINSVPDTYNANMGIALKIPGTSHNSKFKGLRFRITSHIEGLRKYDLIGRNNGFRQPGYAISLGPGFSYSYGRDMLLVDVPIVFNRHIDPGATILPGLPERIRGVAQPARLNFNRQMGLVAPLSLSVRYVHAF